MKKSQNCSLYQFILLISVLLFSLLVISQNEYTQPLGNFSPPAPPQINIPTIAANEKLYIYGSGKVAKLDSTGIIYIHNDYLSSASLETDQNRNIIASNTYYPFGAALTQSGTEKYTFAGKELDKTELQYFGARYYDQDTGRFTQIDPIGPGYHYANSNPLKFVDPTGEEGFNVIPDDFEATSSDQIRASDLPSSVTGMLGESTFESLRSGSMGPTTIYDINGAVGMANPTGYWVAWRPGEWNSFSEHEFKTALGIESFSGGLSSHAADIAFSSITTAATRIGIASAEQKITQKLMDRFGFTDETRLYRAIEPEFLDIEAGVISGNPNSVALISDFYHPKLSGFPRWYGARKAGPGLNVGTNPESIEYFYYEPGRSLISIKLGDALNAGGRIYPDVGCCTEGASYITFNGKIPFQIK